MRKKQEKRIIRASLLFIGLFSVGTGVGAITTHSFGSVAKVDKKATPVKSNAQMNASQSSSSSVLRASSAKSSSDTVNSAPVGPKEATVEKDKETSSAQSTDPAVAGT